MEQKEIKTIGIRGSAGLVGSAVSLELKRRGYKVVSLGRNFTREDIAGCDVIINLAGHSINCKWNQKNRELIYKSRIETTERIARFINECKGDCPELFISASASGIYPSMPVNGVYNTYNEDSPERGSNFLAHVCTDWESAASKAEKSCRVAIIRLGVVLSEKGGAFSKLALPFRMGVAPVISHGRQPFPWIHIDDLTEAVCMICGDEPVSGIYNMVSPEKSDNRKITAILAKRYKAFIKITLPRFLFRILLGNSHILVTEGQYIEPQKLISAGFKFRHSSFEDAVKEL